MGYDFALDELKEVKEEDIELSPDELEAAAEGRDKIHDAMKQHTEIYKNMRHIRLEWVNSSCSARKIYSKPTAAKNYHRYQIIKISEPISHTDRKLDLVVCRFNTGV